MTVASDVAVLDGMDWAALKAFWRKRFGSEPPVGRVIVLLRYEIAWRLQAETHGDVDPASRRLLRAHARVAARAATKAQLAHVGSGLELGARLVREWRGRTYHVKVLPAGFEFEGRTYRSLSVIAREITGARWSGPRLINGAPFHRGARKVI